MDDDGGFMKFARGWNSTVRGWGNDIQGTAKSLYGYVKSDDETMYEGPVSYTHLTLPTNSRV